MATETMGEHRGGFAERDGAGVSAGRPVLVHHVVARQGDKGLEVLRMPLEGKGETLPVFTAGWAARGYLFAGEAPGWGWHVRACTPGELASLLIGHCAGVEWVALDPRPGRSGGEAANVMPREHFADYLLCSRTPLYFDGATSRPSGVRRMGEKTIGSGRQGSVPSTCRISKDECERSSTADPTRKASILARTA